MWGKIAIVRIINCYITLQSTSGNKEIGNIRGILFTASLIIKLIMQTLFT
jgi:hypothetical protein